MTTWSPPDAALAARLIDRFGDGAQAWLDRLPEAVEALAARWSLSPVAGAPAGGGGTSVVVRCRVANGAFETEADRGGVRARGAEPARGTVAGRSAGAIEAVLKLTPDPSLSAAEADALDAWSWTGAVPAVWARDDAAGALLMEAVGDGATLSSRALPDPDRIGELLRWLHTVPVDAIDAPPLAERVGFVFGLWERRRAASEAARARVPREAMARGGELADALARDGGAPTVLLHGDLHPGNVIDAGPTRGLVAIDPRPCVGDPAFDAIDWVLWGRPDEGQADRRIAALAPHAGGNPDRLHAWCAAFTPLLAVSRAIRSG